MTAASRITSTLPCTHLPLSVCLPPQILVDEGQAIRVVGTHYHNLSSAVVSSLGYASATGFELWRSEGVRPGYDAGEWGVGEEEWRYRMVRDVFEGQDSSSPRFFCLFQGLVYFQVGGSW